MTEGVRGQEPPARGALEKTFLDQKRFDDFLDGVARLGERRRDGLDPDRATAVVLRDRREVAPVHAVAPGTSAKSRTRRNSRPAMRGVPRARRAISFAPSPVMPMPSKRAPRLTISSSSLSE